MAGPCRCHGRISFGERLRKGIPYGVLSIHNEKARREPRLQRLWFIIAGKRGTGRSTLATRFNVLDRDEFMPGEVVVQNSYTFAVDLSTRPELNETGLIYLGILIDPMPIREEVLRYDIDHIRAYIFLFDISDLDSLAEANILSEACEVDVAENTLPCIFVGNKSDLRQNPNTSAQCVDTSYAEDMARKFGAVGYYECSALKNTDVGPILDLMLLLIMR